MPETVDEPQLAGPKAPRMVVPPGLRLGQTGQVCQDGRVNPPPTLTENRCQLSLGSSILDSYPAGPTFHSLRRPRSNHCPQDLCLSRFDRLFHNRHPAMGFLAITPDYSRRRWTELVIGLAKRRQPELYGTMTSPPGPRVSRPAPDKPANAISKSLEMLTGIK